MTHVMAKGANIALPAAAVRAVLRWSAAPGAPDVDASALLLGANGKVRSDADFVFYNQPRHPSGLVRHLPKQQASGGAEIIDTVEVELGKLPAEVDRVVLAGSSEGGSFRTVPGLRLLLFDAAAGESAPALAEFAISDAENVTAMVAGELYRRAGSWKFRAVGQGYTSGLIGLATDFGITVDDAAEGTDAAQAQSRGQAQGQAQTPAPASSAAPTGAVDPRSTPMPAPRPTTPEPGTFTLAPAVPQPQAPAAPAPVAATTGAPTAAPTGAPSNAAPAAPATPPPPTAPPTVPPAPPTPPPGHQPAHQPGHPPGTGYGYPQQPGTGYGYPQQQPGTGYGYPQPTQPYPQQQPGTGYGYPQPNHAVPAQPHPGGYGYPQPGTGQQPPVPPQPPTAQPPAPATGEQFALPPQGPQFQPR
ncbi:TerD family protein [Streptomyces sp. 1331.2]|uniref:TerD family protein n=1 Tax=Streptomyces sp. 1331.2 TaxID=1938835 RepID=UPI000BDD1EFA|nr:TerD family protein [Streptomyces sp. 1331.2]SOB84356.1 Stress response protein SCP2 [Streptomyces sp. 1331.2]